MEKDPTIEQIIEGCQRGESHWQGVLYTRYSARYYAICNRFSPDEELAKDMLIEGFIRVFRSIKKYRGEGVFEAWMYRIFLRAAIRYYHRYCHRHPLAGEMQPRVVVTNNERSIDLREAMRIGYSRLNADQRLAFDLVVVQGYSLVDAAKIMDLTESSIKRRFYPAKEIMQKTLIELGVTE